MIMSTWELQGTGKRVLSWFLVLPSILVKWKNC